MGVLNQLVLFYELGFAKITGTVDWISDFLSPALFKNAAYKKRYQLHSRHRIKRNHRCTYQQSRHTGIHI